MVDQLQLDFENLDYIFQLEKGENGMIHFQGVIRYKNLRANWPDVEAHWERCRNWRASVKYCSKRDTRIAGPWTNLKNVKFRKSVRDPLDGLTLRNFQKEILEIIKSEPDDRKIYWFWESEGNSGKSTLCKHIIMTRNAVLLNGNSKDCFCCLKKFDENRDIDIVIFDIPRCQFNTISYKVIESVKNGMFFSGKYESDFITFNPPHVIVLCNFAPERGMLSEDRWVINYINV